MKHSPEFENLAADAKSRIKEVSVAEARERITANAKLIDVREDIVQTFPDKSTELILYCGGGYRSALAADNLQKMGYTNVLSMAGGWTAWKDANAPVEG
jgi:rhodanese-related sulfurtransferase